MGLNEFSGDWRVGSSGRPEIPKDAILNIGTTGGANGWTLAKNGVPIGQTGQGYQDGGTNAASRVYCTVTINNVDYHFEAVLAKTNNRVLYGHLYKETSPSFPDPGGEGAVGGWSADKQGTW